MKQRSMRAVWVLPLLLLTTLACAQQQPLTGQMMNGNAAESAAQPRFTPDTPEAGRHDSAASSPVVVADYAMTTGGTGEPAEMRGRRVGDVTRSLLQRQVDDQRQGRRLPMLGDEATAAYRRYMRSFNHEIPEFYEAAVGKHAGDGR